jgi:hypothetical protein
LNSLTTPLSNQSGKLILNKFSSEKKRGFIKFVDSKEISGAV